MVSGLVVAGWVELEVSEELAGLGVDDAYVEVGYEVRFPPLAGHLD